MEFKNIFLDSIESVYTICHLQHQEGDYLLAASEGKEGACFAYDVRNQFQKQLVWQGPGGTRSIIQVPGSLDFVATQGFYPDYDAAHCRLVYGHFTDGSWTIQPMQGFPYLHRFDLIAAKEGPGIHFVGISIANSKLFPEDWLDPGKVYVGRLDRDTQQLEAIEELPLRLLKLHGYFPAHQEGYSLISAVEGVFKLYFPEHLQGSWAVEQVYDQEISDLVEVDWSGPKAKDKALILGFQGDRLQVLNALFQQEIYHFPEPTPFGQAFWAGPLAGRASVLFGYREGQAELLLLQMKEQGVVAYPIDRQVGATSVLGFSYEGQDYILSANRAQNQLACYQIVKKEAETKV